MDRLVGGRFRPIRLLRSAGELHTWLGTDVAVGDAVIIKTAPLSAVSSAIRSRVEHEGLILQDSALRAAACDDEVLFVAAPFIEGVPLRERLQQGPLATDETLRVARAILQSLTTCHQKGVLHRKINPGNVILHGGEATLTDFGFPRQPYGDDPETLPYDAACYMSPEQAGLIDHDVGERSDLYSTGVLLYTCLSGHPPFHGVTVADMLRRHLTHRPPELRALGIAAPRALEEILARLLRKDPRDRYQRAEAVLADLAELQSALQGGEPDPAIAIGSRDRRTTLTEPAFVGRLAEVGTLSVAIERSRRGEGGLVTVEGQSGGGKTRLLDEVARRALQRGIWVLRGRASHREGAAPFQILGGLIGDILSTQQADPDHVAAVKERIGDRLATVCSILPALCDAPADVSLGPEAFGEVRTLAALSSLLDALGTAERPAVVMLDDCQWADDLTVRLLSSWQAAASNRHVVVVAAWRSEEVKAGHALKDLHAVERLVLEPLRREDVARLAESMAGPLPPPVLDVVTRLSEGSPFMAQEVLRGLAETAAIRPSDSGWEMDEIALEHAQSSRRAAGFLARRLELLPPETQHLLSVGAVLGKSFDLDTASELSGHSARLAIWAVDEARRRHVVWADEAGKHVVFVHDKVREAILGRMTAQQKRDLHRLAAHHLERTDRGRVYDLAYHFDEAEDPERALPYALAAAEQGRAQHALALAEQQYRIAERAQEFADDDTRMRIQEGLGDVALLRGSYDDAERALNTARALADCDLARARLEGKLGELASKRGDVRTAAAAVEQALSVLGRRVPRNAILMALAALWEIFVQALHTLFPRRFVGRRPAQDAERDLLCMRLYSRLAYTYWFFKGPLPTLWAHLRGMNLAERYPPTAELAQAYSEHAPAMTMIPWFSRGVAYVERSLSIRRKLGDTWGQGQSESFYGIVLYAASRYEEALAHLHEAVRLLDRTGDRWERNIAEINIAMCQLRLGRLAASVETARRVHQSGLEIGDRQASGISLDPWARASGGRIPRAAIHAELGRGTGDAQTRGCVLLAEGVRLLGASRPTEAVKVLEEGVRLVHAASLRQEYVAPLFPWLVTALRHAAAATPEYDPLARRRLLEKARRAARAALWMGRSYRNNLPHALREGALVEALLGRTRVARRLLDRSIEEAEHQGARYEEALSRLARGRLGEARGWKSAPLDLAAARDALHALGGRPEPIEAFGGGLAEAPVTWAVADRFATVLDAGRKVATAVSETEVLAAMEEAIIRLLRAERCKILPVDKPSALVQWALEARRASIVPPEVVDDQEYTRSALVAPVYARGVPQACIYATHSMVSGLFGSDEERLADFVATLGGAALENAEGFRKADALSRDLERRVEERTAQLRQSERQLRITNRELKQANEAKSSFLATMSHEIRTPMNAIIGMTDLALETDLTADQREFLGVAKSSAESLLSLLNDILDFSKIEAGKLDLEPAPFSLRELLGDIVRWLAGRAYEKRLELVVRVAPDVPDAVVGDSLRLRQILVNLVGNAVKFTERGEVEVRVETAVDRIKLTVRDTGPGIPPSKQSVIFEPFTQADPSISRRFGGTGLGLAISKRLVELMGGRIELESEPGEGSRFEFTVRLEVRADTRREPPKELVGLRVLIIEDNAASRACLEELLRAWGMRPLAVSSGKVRPEGLDLALVDSSLPGEDGRDVASALRRAGTPTLMLVPAGASASERGDGSVCKPVRETELMDAMRAALKAGKDWTPERASPSSPPSPSQTRSLKVLAAEDHPVNQQLIQHLLERRGHRVTVVGDGAAAVEAVAKDRYDVVLMDVQMPVMDGLEATRRIREWEKDTHVPIVAMTAAAMKGDRERCLEAGMDAYLSKPLQGKQVFQVIEELAGEGDPAQDVSQPDPATDGAEVLNVPTLMYRVSDDAELLARLVEIYGRTTPELVDALSAALESGDLQQALHAVHKLAGSLTNLAAEESARVALRMQDALRAPDLATARTLFPQLTEALTRLGRRLETLV